MTPEQHPRDALRPYRPLPSIDVPLLREERSAVRSRRFVRVVIIVVMLAAASIAAFGVKFLGSKEQTQASGTGNGDAPSAEIAIAPGEPTPQETKAATASVAPAVEKTRETALPSSTLAAQPGAEPPPSSAVSAATSKREFLFGKAISFKDALEKNAGLSRDEANELIAALTGTLDFRRSQPTDKLTIERDSAGALVRFEVRSGLTQRYEAVRGKDKKLVGKQIQVPIKIVRIERGGTVTGSLGDALEGLSLGRNLAGLFTEVFEGKVNFSTDTRSGDVFRIIMDEEYVEGTFLRYGAVHALSYQGEKSGTHQAFFHKADKSDGDYYDSTGRAMHGGWLRTPLRYDHISSGFGMRFHPVLKRKQLHNGIDYAAAPGTGVRAAAAGTITFAGPKGANGNLVVIAHASGYESFYAHLLRFAPGIKKGAKVSQRQLIAYVGSTGRSTGPHLHFSLKRGGKFVDPSTQLNGPGLPMAQNELPEYRRKMREMASALERVRIEQPKPVNAPTPLATTQDLGEEEL